LLGVFPLEILVSLMVTNYIFKVVIEIAFTPFTLIFINSLKSAEREDYYDTSTVFNPFQFDL